ncbi:MAG: alkaline phosphatase [Candidatus Methanoperedens sp.]|nr:alkaline phosphatase [Candidatus Methanoperedens sp. BLZ2]MBZ0175906.1 alkaline phosphatase [Candidatus Methanoperedens nitroreducens]MCX9076418.1 alkaline phosphatase [Candidatus Methanoperedens sp.]MCX9088032.1 alkaline phosphatase [Candidatus Methanoperedens sp.]
MNKNIKLIGICALLLALPNVMAVIFVPSNANINNELSESENYQENHKEVKNIILMVPDGMGLADVTAARIYKNGPDEAPLYLETLENIGYQRTYSANSIITDSAAAGSAWACGEKFNNGEICYHVDGRPYNPSILEMAKAEGKATGLVATSTITHATPAVFGAHVKSRNCENEIARQYIEITGVDLMLGGGVVKFNSTKPDTCGTSGNFIAEAEQKGYQSVYTRAGMDSAVANGTVKLLGLFNNSSMTPEYLRISGTTEPRLPEMTSAALNILEKDRDGFFLMVEGSQIDWANHANDLKYQMGETLAFDESVKVVLDWTNASPKRKEHTLLIIVPDHETGGFAVNGPDRLLRAGESVTAGWTSDEHTGVDTIIWSQGPGSKALGRAVENTDLYGVMIKALEQ